MSFHKHHNLNWINNLRLISLYAVIILHTTAPLLGQYGKVPLAEWLTADFYNSLVRFAVPAFVMITGTLLLHRDYELLDFLKRRLGRIIAPFIFWSLVYVAYSWYNEEIAFDGSTWANIKQILHLLKYGSAYHLWYVYMLIGLYFVIPIISRFVRHATDNEVLYFLLVWFFVMMISQPYLARFNPQIDLHYFAGYIGYLVLGHYLAFRPISWPYARQWMVGLFFLSLGVIAAGTYLLFKQNGLSTLLYEPLSPTIMMLSISIFMLTRIIVPKVPAFIIRARDFAGKYTFGIYLSHALVLYLLDDFDINYKLCIPVISIPLTALTCFVLSLLLVYIINKIPFGKHISG